MANPSANQIKIDLSGNLCLNELDCEVHSFEGFNERNTQILGNGLKPFYQHIDETDEQVIYDRNEDKWTYSFSNGTKRILRNNKELFSNMNETVSKEKIEKEFFYSSGVKIDAQRILKFKNKNNGKDYYFIITTDKNYQIIYEDGVQVSSGDGAYFFDFFGIEEIPFVALYNNNGGLVVYNLDTLQRIYITVDNTNFIDCIKFSANSSRVEYTTGGFTGNLPLIIFEFETTSENYIFCLLLKYSNGRWVFEEEDFAEISLSGNKYKFNPCPYAEGGYFYDVYPSFFKYDSSFLYSTDVIKKEGETNQIEWLNHDLSGFVDKTFQDFRNGNAANIFAPGGQVVCEDKNLCGYRAFHVIQGLTVAEGETGIPVVYTQIGRHKYYPVISQTYNTEKINTIKEDAASVTIYPSSGSKSMRNLNYQEQLQKNISFLKNGVYRTSLWSNVRGCLNIKIPVLFGKSNLLINFQDNCNSVTGISIGNTLVTRWGGVNYNEKVIITVTTSNASTRIWALQYLNENHESYIIQCTKTDNIPLKFKYVFNRYIITNLISTSPFEFNAYDILTNKPFIYADDWNNRCPIDLTVGTSASNTEIKFFSYASGNGQIFQIDNEAQRSCIFPPLYGYITCPADADIDKILKNALYEKIHEYNVDVYYSVTSEITAEYKFSLVQARYISKRSFVTKSFLVDTLYTVGSSLNMYLSPDLMAEYIQLSNNDWVIASDGNSYIATKYDFENMLLYQIGTLIQDIDDIFSIQGQFYAIKNNTLFLVTISEGIITSNTIIYYLQDLQFIGATLQYALFYAPKQKSIYIFSGDRRLELLGPTNDIDYVNTYFYDNSQNTIFIGCDKFILCYKDNYFWKIHIPEVKQFFFTDRGIEFIADDKIGLIHNYYHADDKAEMSVIPVNLETAFYGFGENRIGIIDCWNIRLFSKDKLSGNVKLKITSLTDKGTVGEEATISIKESDWDNVTKTYLLRFQPRLQRGIGLSLAIVSDFELYDLQVSATPDSALQITERRVI